MMGRFGRDDLLSVGKELRRTGASGLRLHVVCRQHFSRSTSRKNTLDQGFQPNSLYTVRRPVFTI